jgi:hypothetical protein
MVGFPSFPSCRKADLQRWLRSWANLDRRIGEQQRLVSGIKTWQRERDAAGARANWKFTTAKARHKLALTIAADVYLAYAAAAK